MTQEYVNFSSYDAERGRLISPTEVDVARPAVVHRRADGRPSVRSRYRSARQDHPNPGASISASSASARSAERLLGQIAGRIRRHAARAISADVRLAAAVDRCRSSRGDFEQIEAGDRRHDAGAADRAPPEAEPAGQLRDLQFRHGARHLPHRPRAASSRCSSASSALSLVVGGIVIMNIMLMVVTERTREIGLRKALGARRSDIMTQILTESVVLSVFGGVVGTILGAADRASPFRSFTPDSRRPFSCGRSCSASASRPWSGCSSACIRRRGRRGWIRSRHTQE